MLLGDYWTSEISFLLLQEKIIALQIAHIVYTLLSGCKREENHSSNNQTMEPHWIADSWIVSYKQIQIQIQKQKLSWVLKTEERAGCIKESALRFVLWIANNV
jgi:hypothetical protein